MKKFLSVISITLCLSALLSTTASASIKYQTTINSVVEVISYGDNDQTYSQGSGFFISVDGFVLTNFHVIANDQLTEPNKYTEIWTIENEYSEPTPKYLAEIIAYDANLDLALLAPAYEIDENGKIIETYLADFRTDNYIDLADYNPFIGDNINILGFPAASLNKTISLTTGIVSGFSMLSSFVPDLTEDWVYEIQTDATINPGNSGGPAFNDDERVVGVATEIAIDGEGGSYGYIISNDIIYLWFDKLVKDGIMNAEYISQVFGNDYSEVSSTDSDKLDQTDVKIFNDVETSSKNSQAIKYLKDNDIIGGYADGSFKASNSINRAELLKILVEGIGNRPDAEKYKNCFPDVKNEWYAKYICYAKEQNWISGYSDGTFKPGNAINKAEAMKMLLKTFNITLIQPFLAPFDDINTTDWYSQYVNTAKLYALLEENKTYWPGAEITRGQVSENIYRAIMAKEFGYERKLYTNAMLEAGCYVTNNSDASDTKIGLKGNAIFKKFGFDTAANPALILELIDKYAQDEEVKAQIEAASSAC